MQFVRTYWAVLAALICGLALTLPAAHWSRQEMLRQNQLVQARLASSQAERLEHRINLHAELLRGLQSVLLARPELSAADLLRIVEQQNALIRHPGFVSIVRLYDDGAPLRVEHVYPRNLSAALAADQEIIRTWRQARETHRGLLSAAFVPAGQQRPHVALVFPAPRGGVAMLYRLDLLGATLGIGSPIRGWRLSDRGSVSDRGAPIRFSQLFDQSFPADMALERASALVNLPGRQWQMEIWVAPPAAPEAAGRILAQGTALTLIFSLLILAGLQRSRPVQDLLPHKEDDLLARAAAGNPEIIVLRDAEGRIVFANPAAQQLLAEDLRPLTERRDALLVSAELGRLDAPFYCDAERRDRRYEVLLLPLPLQKSGASGTAMFARDRTRHQAELQTLQARLARHEKLQALLSEFFWEQDAEGRFTHVGGAMFSRHALTAQYFIGKTLHDLGEGGIDPAGWQAHQRIRDERQPFHDLAYTLLIDHAPLDLLLSGLPRYEADGRFCGYYGIGRDVSAIRRSQNQLQAERQRIVATLESISDGIITTGLDGRVDYINPVASALTGWEPADALGQPIEQILQVVEPQSRLPLVTLLRKVLQSGQAPQTHRCGILLNRFGLSFLIQEAVACVRNERGEIIGAVLVFRDLTDWNAPQEQDA